MTDTNHEGSRNGDGERSIGSCFGYAQKELETSQRTDHLGKRVLGAHRSRGVVMRISTFFFDIRLVMIVFLFPRYRGSSDLSLR